MLPNGFVYSLSNLLHRWARRSLIVLAGFSEHSLWKKAQWSCWRTGQRLKPQHLFSRLVETSASTAVKRISQTNVTDFKTLRWKRPIHIVSWVVKRDAISVKFYFTWTWRRVAATVSLSCLAGFFATSGRIVRQWKREWESRRRVRPCCAQDTRGWSAGSKVDLFRSASVAIASVSWKERNKRLLFVSF